MRVKLGKICKFQSGGTPAKSNPQYFGGNIPWITTTALNGNSIGKEVVTTWITDIAIRESAAKIVPSNSIMVGTRVGIGKVAINVIPMSTSQDIISLTEIDEKRWDKRYLCKLILASNSFLLSQARGATIKGIKIETLANLEIPSIPLNEQRHIAAVLDKVTDLIAKRQAQLDKLNELVKARFMEMFGDPEINSLKLPSCPMPNLCEIIDGDRGSNYPKQEDLSSEGYCLFLNAKNVTSSGFCFDECLYISKEKDSVMRKGKLRRGDIVLTTRGTIGNLAFYDHSIPFENVRINSGMVLLRIHKDQITEIFFIEQFRILLNYIKRKIANGSAQPQLPISTMRQIKMLVPPLKDQATFNDIVIRSQTLKSNIDRSLNQMKNVKKSIMQKYFE